jgi:hypothetical protein
MPARFGPRGTRFQRIPGMGAMRPLQHRPAAIPPWVTRNPFVRLWAQTISRRLGIRRQFVDRYSRELKAIQDALSPSGSPPSPPVPGPWARGGRFQAWRPRWGGVQPYAATDVSTDLPPVSSTIPPDDTTDTGDSTAPIDDTVDEPTSDGKDIPPSKLYAIFEEMYDDSQQSTRKRNQLFTESFYPKMAVLHERLDDAHLGPSDGYQLLSADDAHAAYDRWTHHEQKEKATGHEEDDDRGSHNRDDDDDSDKPSSADLVKVFERLKAADKELTEDGYPYVSEVNEIMPAHFKRVTHSDVVRAWHSKDGKKIATAWREEEEGEDEVGAHSKHLTRPTNDELLGVIEKAYASGDVTTRNLPKEDAVNAGLARLRPPRQEVDAAHIKRAVESKKGQSRLAKYLK